MKKKVYLVEQAVLSSTGHGDYGETEEFDNLEEAYKYFNKIKYDTKGWVFGRSNYVLNTVINLVTYYREDEYDPWEFEDSEGIDGFTVDRFGKEVK